ncbi:alternative ribosome rescue aminoacyl-tRNA hydrolase ArfB [Desulfosudis oleivorans]|uniref:Class I peptide chain release factor n=1 Tax=Desulfosudis oleivorans (strain DSM 6200 / JCM 39069 / Hxd3) TaxID=96561 RepID=A9A0M9_DESOH|nr:alternative ribosome rescue aminoacyl-tRNA hydrolase ArfB [Desulfosudis oleivorans]ABW67529.1 Class I peptide chain release factor [Desulfosudis oleivorans Hxd3]
MLTISRNIAIDENELTFKFIRASGPGGQNVNKVASAVQLRFDVAHSPSLPGPVKNRLIKLAGRRISEEGVLVIEAKRFREQGKNRQDAIDRLVALVARALVVPRARKKTAPTKASKRRTVDEKVYRGRVKQRRGRVRGEE